MTRHQRCLRHLLGLALAGAILLVAASLAGAAALWSTPEMVGQDDDYDDDFANVEVSSDGTVWIVWGGVDSAQTDEEVYCVRLEDFVQSPRERVHPNNSVMDRCPLMSVGSDDIPWVVFERYSSTLGYLQVVTHWTGSGWAPADTVFRHGARWDNYTIHASSSDDVWVAKSSTADGRPYRDIFLRHWDGVSWGTSERVGFSGWEDTDPALTVDESGRPWLAWLRFDLSRLYRNFVYASVREDEGWSEPALVDTGPGNLVVCDLNMTPDGRPLVVWRGDGNSTASNLKYATLGWAGWEYGGLVNQPDNPTTEADSSARLSRGLNGELWVAWVSSVWAVTPTAITASRWLGDGWSEEELVSAPDTLSLREDWGPDVAVAGDGRVWTVWWRRQENTPRDTDIYMAYREVTTGINVWGLIAEPVGGSVRLRWQASLEIARSGLHVWRAEGEACPETPGLIPDGATRLTEVAIHDCTSCAFADVAASPGSTYCYWLADADGGVFGPATATVPDVGSSSGIFSVSPNPAGHGVAFRVAGMGGSCEVRIFTAGGKIVRALPVREAGVERAPGEESTIHWDGTDGLGSTVPSGVYYAVLCERGSDAATARVRFVLVR